MDNIVKSGDFDLVAKSIAVESDRPLLSPFFVLYDKCRNGVKRLLPFLFDRRSLITLEGAGESPQFGTKRNKITVSLACMFNVLLEADVAELGSQKITLWARLFAQMRGIGFGLGYRTKICALFIFNYVLTSRKCKSQYKPKLSHSLNFLQFQKCNFGGINV